MAANASDHGHLCVHPGRTLAPVLEQRLNVRRAEKGQVGQHQQQVGFALLSQVMVEREAL